MSWAAIVMDPGTLGPLALTAKVLAVNALLLFIIGVPLAYFLSNYKGWLREIVDIIVTLPLVFPPIATGFALLLLLGRNGPLQPVLGTDIIFSFKGVVLAAFISALPMLVKTLQTALEDDKIKQLSQSAQILGKSKIETLLQVYLPTIKMNIAAGMVLGLGRSMGEVGITLMLGGNIIGKTNTLSLEIYNAVFCGEFDRAIVLSLIVGLMSIIIFIILKRWSAI